VPSPPARISLSLVRSFFNGGKLSLSLAGRLWEFFG